MGIDKSDSENTDARDTGEHFFGSLVNGLAPEADDSASRATARRVADLSTQIDWLDNEVARYRELIESERIRHATELADQQLAADTRLDELRRDERLQTQAVHDSYRSLLNDRQLEHERAISRVVSDSAAELAAERQRHEEILEHERTRRRTRVEATRQQTIDELTESHQNTRQSMLNELAQAATTIERLQAELDTFVARAQRAEIQVHDYEIQVAALQQRIDTLEDRSRSQNDDVQAQLDLATRRLEAERQRSAATLAEVLERSASIASDADKARSEFAEEKARAEHVAASALKRAEADYVALQQAMDERSGFALDREAELEAVIAELRAELGGKRP